MCSHPTSTCTYMCSHPTSTCTYMCNLHVCSFERNKCILNSVAMRFYDLLTHITFIYAYTHVDV